jgi:hypothetical protein
MGRGEAMKQILWVAGAAVLLFLGGIGWAQTTQPGDSVDLAPGFKMRSSGGIDVGQLYAEVVQFGTDWKEIEEHDVFKPEVSSPDGNTHVVTGEFVTPSGTFHLTEHIAAGDGGIHFSADVSSEKDIACNELSVALTLPVAAVGGKQIFIDGQALAMPMEPAKKGESHLLEKENVQKIEIPTPDGTLTITGNFAALVQDDREWGDQRYAARLQFSPSKGNIKESKIELKMEWKAQ